MKTKLFIVTIVGALGMLSLTREPSPAPSRPSTPETRRLESPSQPRPQRLALVPDSGTPAPDSNPPSEESFSAEEGERYAALAYERFQAIVDIPGARGLALDIKNALEDNPTAFDFSTLTEGPDHELRADYLETMIADPELRAKWVALMELVQAYHAQREG